MPNLFPENEEKRLLNITTSNCQKYGQNFFEVKHSTLVPNQVPKATDNIPI